MNLNEIILVKHLGQCPAHSEYDIRVNYCRYLLCPNEVPKSSLDHGVGVGD